VAHALRSQHDAVLVGSGTVLADDPRLTVRLLGAPRGAEAPVRVVLDGRLRTPVRAKVLGAAARTIIYTRRASHARARALRARGAEVIELPGRGALPVARVLADLAARDIQSVLVEGGAAVHAAFLEAGLFDDVALFVAPRMLGGGVPLAPGLARELEVASGLDRLAVRRIGPDLLLAAQASPEK
jgi:diaminohydroxyphosphoribosylaminopyrimidine deaminase/5-amino-6-(5-phosphoribosylamino)uracil reductase